MMGANNMKLHKPFFSTIVIIFQLIISLKDYYKLQEWKKANPGLDALINKIIHYDTLFLFVLIIGGFEMLTKPSWFKNLIRIFLVCIVLGHHFSEIIPIEGFKFGVYNTAWFSAVIAIVLISIRVGKYSLNKRANQKL